MTRDENAEGKPVVAVVLSKMNVTDADLKKLTAFKSLIITRPHVYCLTDAGLKELSSIKLRLLNLW